jgi:uncharacterized protein involved in type VI secretion and phage assembly
MNFQTEWESRFVESEEERRSRCYGKYPGFVVDANDPEHRGRVKARVPNVFQNDHSVWCVPAVPFAGKSFGLLLLPKKDDSVWVEFEAGDTSRPLWTGSWWAKDELPAPNGVNQHVLTTPKGLQIVLDDDAKKLQLKHPDGAEITMSSSAITIKIGSAQIQLSSDGVSINNGALEVK